MVCPSTFVSLNDATHRRIETTSKAAKAISTHSAGKSKIQVLARQQNYKFSPAVDEVKKGKMLPHFLPHSQNIHIILKGCM